MISQVGELVRAADENECPYYRYEGITVQGDLAVSTFREVCKVVRKDKIKGLPEEERILSVFDMACREHPGESGDIEVKTCTDCNLGLVSGAGRELRLRRTKAGWRIFSARGWIS